MCIADAREFMADSPVSVLVVADDPALADRVTDCVSRRDNRLVCLPTGSDAIAAASTRSFDVILIAFDRPSESNIHFVKQLKTHAANTEVIVVFDTHCGEDAAADLWTLAEIVAPFDQRQLLAALDGTLEPRRATLHNRRLLWELQVINETSEVISRSLELDDVLTGALQRLVPALDAAAGVIRLRDELTGHYEIRAVVGPTDVCSLWEREGSEIPRPSDEVIATRAAVVFEDLARFLPDDRREALPVRSSISVPMFGNDQLLGTLSVSAAKPFRFGIGDEHLLSIVAGQIAVAVQNARLHDSVRRGKREWEQTFDAISDPIAVFDGRGLLLRGNTALANVLGTKVTGIRHRTCQDVGFCGSKCPHCAVRDALTRGAAGRAEVTLPNGQIFSVTTFPVAGGAEGASVVQVAKNVTEEIRSARRLRQMSEEIGVANARLRETLDQLKSTQAQLLQAEKISAIGQLVAGVAHELNNPLTSVIGYAQLLEEELLEAPSIEALRLPAVMAKDLRRIAEESERAARIVRNLLAFARRQTAARAPQDVADLIGRVLSLRTYELRLNGIELETEFEAGLPPVFADSGQLQQALLNLILNAEQAMRGRSTRRLAVSAKYDESAGAVELAVADTGHGIDHANLTRIFDPFFTTREVGEGTGLGLSICYGIIRDHGGHITVDSRAQVGTRFSILLPARVDESAQEDEEILVAHADQGDRDFVAAALGAWGHPVSAVGADEALARYRRGRLQAVIVDRAVVAADLEGWTSARAADTRRVPLILMSMTAEDPDIERFGREQASAVLAPPFQLRALRSAVRTVAKEYA
jgi:signal transduction histidine kinase/DNA-binding response OmpR family regulator